jgi:hypothetical protein
MLGIFSFTGINIQPQGAGADCVFYLADCALYSAKAEVPSLLIVRVRIPQRRKQFAVIPNGTVYGVGSVAREVLDMYRGRGAYYKMFDYPFSKDYKPETVIFFTAHDICTLVGVVR